MKKTEAMRRVILVAGPLILAGCSYTRPMTIAPMALGPKETPIAVVNGAASATYFFGFNMGGDNTFKEALEDAKLHSPASGDTLGNVFADQHLFCFPACFFPIIETMTTSVTGTLFRYEGASFNRPTPAPTQKPAAGDSGAL